MTNSARLKLDLRFHDFACRLIKRLLDVEHSKRLYNCNKESIVCDPSAGADAPSVAEDEVAWIGFCFVGWCIEVSLRTEGHWVGVDCRIVGEPPADLVLER